MHSQLLLGVLLVEVMGARLVQTDSDLARIKTIAKAGLFGCMSYGMLAFVAMSLNSEGLRAALSAVSGFMSLYFVATLTAIYFLVQVRLKCDQQLCVLALVVGLCSYCYFVF